MQLHWQYQALSLPPFQDPPPVPLTWFQPASEPVREKPRIHSDYYGHFTYPWHALQVMSAPMHWYQRASEPVRERPRIRSHYHGFYVYPLVGIQQAVSGFDAFMVTVPRKRRFQYQALAQPTIVFTPVPPDSPLVWLPDVKHPPWSPARLVQVGFVKIEPATITAPLAEIIDWLYPQAIMGVNVEVRDDGPGEYIYSWAIPGASELTEADVYLHAAEYLVGKGTIPVRADKNDWDLGDKMYLPLMPDTDGWIISGMAGGAEGYRRTLENLSDVDTITLAHLSVSSTDGNRLNLPGGVDALLDVRESLTFVYHSGVWMGEVAAGSTLTPA